MAFSVNKHTIVALVCTLAFAASSCTAANIVDSGADFLTETPTPVLIIPTITAMPLCTPPPCGENEAYFCRGECPGDCGTTCATHTPPPLSEDTFVHTAPTSQFTHVNSFPDPQDYNWATVVSGLKKPLGLTNAGDNTGRLFIIEQSGLVQVIENEQVISTPFLDIRSRVEDLKNEQGLLGLAFHPNYASNGFFFVNYTGHGGDTVVSRFSVSIDANLGDPDSETVLLRIKQPYANHNGGHIAFGPDGYLYLGLGDGGLAGDPNNNAQNPVTLLGKMLRIDVDHGSPYAIPGDNLYAFGGGSPEIWAVGLRNPWRFSFDLVTGSLFIGDVGQNQWEEINYLAIPNLDTPPVINFGWDFWEGHHPYEGSPPDGLEMVAPIWEYPHSLGCSVTGGVVYRGMIPEWQGVYLYGDYCTGTIWGLLQDENGKWVNTTLFQTEANITSFGCDEQGEIYYIDQKGDVLKLLENR